MDALLQTYAEYRELMRHWDEVLPGRVTHVKYEELVGNLNYVLHEAASVKEYPNGLRDLGNGRQLPIRVHAAHGSKPRAHRRPLLVHKVSPPAKQRGGGSGPRARGRGAAAEGRPSAARSLGRGGGGRGRRSPAKT